MSYFPEHITFQWHLTDRCNLRCLHCYQDDYSFEGLPFESWKRILEQLGAFVVEAERFHKREVPVRFNFTGGEPFLREDFPELLELVRERHPGSRIGILSNGTLLNRRVLRRIKAAGISFIQLSLEGDPKTNDLIRGGGSFRRIAEAVRLIKGEEIAISLSFTASKRNFRSFKGVYRAACRLGVNWLWLDRSIPCKEEERNEQLSPAETEWLYRKAAQLAVRARRWGGTQVSMNRALQFLTAGGRSYRCPAGDSLLTIGAGGELLPCRRMPLKVGNLLERELIELYQSSSLLIRLRHRCLVSSGCENCYYRERCNGGLRCLSYAIYGSPFYREPGCWLRKGDKL